MVVSLSPGQLAVLEALVAAEGAVVGRDELATALWGTSTAGRGNTIEAHVSALRRKLDDPFHVESFLAVYGRGYRLAHD